MCLFVTFRLYFTTSTNFFLLLNTVFWLLFYHELNTDRFYCLCTALGFHRKYLINLLCIFHIIPNSSIWRILRCSSSAKRFFLLRHNYWATQKTAYVSGGWDYFVTDIEHLQPLKACIWLDLFCFNKIGLCNKSKTNLLPPKYLFKVTY